MPMAVDEITRLLREAFPGAAVTIEDLAGDGDHYRATVVSEAFRGRSRLQQHQMVYAALGARVGGELHALAVRTGVPDGLV